MTARLWSPSISEKFSTSRCPSGRSPRGDQPVTDVVAALKAKIEILEAELAKTEERSAGHRADFERERARVDQLMSELLTATADLMAARTVTARLEGEIAALRDPPKPADHQPVTPRTWRDMSWPSGCAGCGRRGEGQGTKSADRGAAKQLGQRPTATWRRLKAPSDGRSSLRPH